MTAAFRGLRTHQCVLIPHLLEPLLDDKESSDLTIMKSGIYNLGFLALRRDAAVRAALRWWSNRCFTDCRVDIAGHLFTDQRWVDLFPSILDRVLILRYPGYDVSYWNLAHRAPSQRSNGWMVGRHRLVFFHFSGIDPDDPAIFSRHQNRFTRDSLGATRQLCDA